VLEKYELYEFVPLVESMRKGDLRTFNDTLVRYQDRFIWYVCGVVLQLLCWLASFSLVFAFFVVSHTMRIYP
jgi:hypothetical protein